jgi:hypothetical protein
MAFRDDIINEEFIKKVLEHHLATKHFELIDFQVNAGTAKGDNYMGDLVLINKLSMLGGYVVSG